MIPLVVTGMVVSQRVPQQEMPSPLRKQKFRHFNSLSHTGLRLKVAVTTLCEAIMDEMSSYVHPWAALDELSQPHPQ
ncbi:MAG: hypothetical protein Q9M13_09075 [Mariprofundales bacterium]|nr:hypothetical protein [Mariprofundales bacterium]